MLDCIFRVAYDGCISLIFYIKSWFKVFWHKAITRHIKHCFVKFRIVNHSGIGFISDIIDFII